MSALSSKLRRKRQAAFDAWFSEYDLDAWMKSEGTPHSVLMRRYGRQYRFDMQKESFKKLHNTHPVGDYRMPVNGRMRGKHRHYNGQTGTVMLTPKAKNEAPTGDLSHWREAGWSDDQLLSHGYIY